MAKGTALERFTSLRESNGGRLRSKPTSNGRRVYEGVTIIKAGLGNQRDRNYYPADVLEANAQRFHGLRAYADHQDSLSEEVQPERTIRDMVGVYKNPRFVREGKHGRILADLHLFRSSKWLSDTVDDLIELGQADKIGLSINGRGRTVEKQIQIEEAADPINVNYVEDFMVLRSADVVTEAGAGGGFPQLLESARGTTQETAMKPTEQQKQAIKEAAEAMDLDKLAALLKECGCTDVAAPPKGKAKPATTPVAEAEDTEDDGEAETEDESEDSLDAEADAIMAEADDEDGDEADAEEVEEADADDAEDAEDDVEEAATRESLANVRAKGAGKLIGGKSGGKGKHGGTIKGAAGHGKVGNAIGKRSGQKGQAGRRFGEADASSTIEKLLNENARLSAQLRIRTTTDRARNLLRESAIPRKMQPEVLRLMVGKSEDEMRRVVRYHERFIESAVSEAVGGEREVEGAGTRFRESHYGNGTGDMSDVLDDIGLPLKD